MTIYIDKQSYHCLRFESTFGFSPLYGDHIVKQCMVTIEGILHLDLCPKKCHIKIIADSDIIYELEGICDMIIIEPKSNKSLARFVIE